MLLIATYNILRGDLMLGKRLTELRKSRCLTQEQYSSLINVTRDTYAQYEIDRRQPDYETLQKIADYYNVTTDYLLGRTEKATDTTYKVSPSSHCIVSGSVPTMYNDPTEKIKAAIASDPELATFWEELSQREDLQLMFKQTRDLSPQSIKKVIKIIKAIEDEESEE